MSGAAKMPIALPLPDLRHGLPGGGALDLRGVLRAIEPAYDLYAIDGTDFRKQVEAGPASLWRYEALLPGGPGLDRVDLGAGFTPLRRADRLRRRPRVPR